MCREVFESRLKGNYEAAINRLVFTSLFFFFCFVFFVLQQE